MSVLLVPVRHAPSIGGIETLLAQTVPLLRDDGHEFVVLTGSDDGRESFDLAECAEGYSELYRSLEAPAALVVDSQAGRS